MSEKMQVCLVSLRCAPGLQKEMDALCDGFSRNGWFATQLLAEDYRAFRPATPEITFVPLRRDYGGMLGDVWSEFSGQSLQRILTELRPDLVLFYNQSPLNLLLMRLRKKSPDCRFGVFVHDPWKARKFSHGPAFALVYSFVEWLQKRMVRRCEHVITLSSYGTALVESHYPGCRGKIIEGRILLRNGSDISESARSVVSIIGRINPSTGHDEFLSIAKDLRSKLSGIAFEIVTSSPCATEEGFVIRANEAGVRIEFKPVLSEVEIEAAISRSVCVFRLDGELTQSGVLPLCYRLGTPVVARDIAGLAQHVIEGKTGYLLRPSTTILQLASWISEIRERQGQYRIDCRAAFQQDWAESAFDRYYSNLVGLSGRMS